MEQKKTSSTSRRTSRRIVIRVVGLFKGKGSQFTATAPPLPALSLRSLEDPRKCYTIAPDMPVSVDFGSYYVRGSYIPTEEGRVQGGKVYSRPPITVESEITVTAETREYEVSARYDCFALVIDTSVCEKYRIRGYSGAMMDMPWMFGPGVKKVAYLTGNWTFPALDLVAVPNDPEHDLWPVSIVTDTDYDRSDRLLAVYGFWYSFNPAGQKHSLGEIRNAE